MYNTQKKFISYTLVLAILGGFTTPGEAKTETKPEAQPDARTGVISEAKAEPKAAVSIKAVAEPEIQIQASIANVGKKKSFGYSNRYGTVTPSQVYGLHQDYEALFMYYAKRHKKELAAQIKALYLVPVAGKTPDNVFDITNHLSDSLDRLAKSLRLKPTKRVAREKAKAIPAEVYLQAGNNIDTLVKIMDKLEPEKNWGDYYANREYRRAKNPSDVFALADLSARRLDLILYGANLN